MCSVPACMYGSLSSSGYFSPPLTPRVRENSLLCCVSGGTVIGQKGPWPTAMAKFHLRWLSTRPFAGASPRLNTSTVSRMLEHPTYMMYFAGQVEEELFAW